MGRIIVVTSGKGGVGKSTVSAALATALCNRVKRVLIIDADEGLRCLDLFFSVGEKLVFDLGDVTSGLKNLNEAILAVDFALSGKLFLLAAPVKSNQIDSRSFSDVLTAAVDDFDFVIVDCPAGLEQKYYNNLPRFAEFLVVTNTDPVSIRDAYETGRFLKSMSHSNISLVVNRFIKKNIASGGHDNIDNIIDKTFIPLLAIIPEDYEVQLSCAGGRPIVNGRAAMAVWRLAGRICGMDIPLPKINKI